MSNKNDRWSALSMKERADLMNMYITSGISDLKEMKRHYNSFSGEEDTENNKVSSDATTKKGLKNRLIKRFYDKNFQPFIDKHGIDSLRMRLYDGIYPASYYDAVARVKNALAGKNESDMYSTDRDDIWAEYLKIPKEKRHNVPGGSYVVDSEYIPTNANTENKEYKTVYVSSRMKDEMIKNAPSNIGESTLNGGLFSALGDFFGPHTLSRGFDNKGEYVSFYDEWDLAPTSKKGGVEDESMGIGTPIYFYDRVYLDDYYNIPEEARGNPFITPSVITAETKKAGGGKLNSFSGEENTQTSDENTKQSKDFLFRWYNNPTTRAIMNKAFPFEKVVPYYNHEGKEFTGESAVRGHLANAIYHTPEYIEKLEDDVGGRYIHDLRNPHIIYNENYVYNNDKVDPRIATHELTHALQYALPYNTLRTSKPVKQELKKGVVPHKYLDSMTEIGAKLNVFRDALNLSPEKRDYSPEDAETLMNTYIERFGEDSTSQLNRFTPETLAGYLNYLAYNDKDIIPTFNSDINYASNGGKLNVFSGEEDNKTINKPLFDPQKIIDNVPAREWGPKIAIGENDFIVWPGTNIVKAPIQYLIGENIGKNNIELAKQIIGNFDAREDKQKHIDENSNYYKAYMDAKYYLDHVEGLKKYLRLPYDNNSIKESAYKPTRLQGTNEKTYKFANQESSKYWTDVIEDMVNWEQKEHQYFDPILNTFTAYRDRDDKGDFISIYDEWDYNPSVQGGSKHLNKIIDVATGGKPFIVYDRIYLDDYYDVPEEFRGNPYITPAVVTAEVKKANGGKLLTKKQK